MLEDIASGTGSGTAFPTENSEATVQQHIEGKREQYRAKHKKSLDALTAFNERRWIEMERRRLKKELGEI